MIQEWEEQLSEGIAHGTWLLPHIVLDTESFVCPHCRQEATSAELGGDDTLVCSSCGGILDNDISPRLAAAGFNAEQVLRIIKEAT